MSRRRLTVNAIGIGYLTVLGYLIFISIPHIKMHPSASPISSTASLVRVVTSAIELYSDTTSTINGATYYVFDANEDGIMDSTPRQSADPLAGVVPGPLKLLRITLTKSHIKAGYLVDSWGNKVGIQLNSMNAKIVYSFGPDGLPLTSDDIYP